MSYNRKDFLKLSGAAAASFMFAPLACSSSKNISSVSSNFGIQLYTLRDELPKDPKGVLAKLASFGYKQIESYEHGTLGMFWGMDPKTFKAYMDQLQMTIISSHCGIDKDFEKKAENAASIGMKYLIYPGVLPRKSLDDFKKWADTFNQRGEVCRKYGIRFAFHNHSEAFDLLEGEVPEKILLENTDPNLVDFEMDMYWVAVTGQDPASWITKYKNRFKLCHVKDRCTGADNKPTTCTLGKGNIDYASILSTAKRNGMQYFIVEQEQYVGTSPLKCVEDNAAYMKLLSI